MPPLTAEIVSFLEGPNSILIATQGGDLVPEIARALTIRCAPDRQRVTITLPTAAARSIAHLQQDGRIAVVLERPTTHRTLQVKGRAIAIYPTPDSDRPFVERSMQAFFGECELVGMPRRLTDRAARWPLVSVDVEIDQAFEQTPGPGAGEPYQLGGPTS